MNYQDHSGGHLKFKKIASSFHVIQKSWSSFSYDKHTVHLVFYKNLYTQVVPPVHPEVVHRSLSIIPECPGACWGIDTFAENPSGSP